MSRLLRMVFRLPHVPQKSIRQRPSQQISRNLKTIQQHIPMKTCPASSSPHCIPRNETFCSNHLNYTQTFYPNFAGDKSEHDFLGSWVFLQTIIDSPRIEEFICLAAQPECRLDGKSIGPCRKLCHGA